MDKKRKFEKNNFTNRNNIVIYPGVKKSRVIYQRKNNFFLWKVKSILKDIFVRATKKLKKLKNSQTGKLFLLALNPEE